MSRSRESRVQTDTAPRHTDTVKFALRAAAWSLGFFGLLRLNWFATTVSLPVTRAQSAVATGVLGTPAMPIDITLACSGADALALCLGTILAYPVSWRARLTGAAGGTALILALNMLRIGTLGQAAASPEFNTLHLYVWPAVLLSRSPDTCSRGCAWLMAARPRRCSRQARNPRGDSSR